MRQLAVVAAVGLVVLLSGCGGGPSHPTPARLPGQSRPPVPGSLSSSGAGHRFYEIYDPSGPARGTMLLIHGGGWTDKRGDARKDMATPALVFRAQGWRVVNVSYTPSPPRPGAGPDPLPMLRDVLAFYDQIRRAYGGPICAYGQSAGAHLVGMLAVERRSLRCAIMDAAPVDLPTLLRETDPAGASLIRNAFGTSKSVLAQWSPARELKRGTNHTAIWATFADGDPVVPPQQGSVLQAAAPSANVAVVPTGSFYWLHSSVDYGAIYNRSVTSLFTWLDRIVPHAKAASAPSGGDVGAGCDQPPPSGQRFKLMLAGDAWQEVSTPGQQLIAATRGCSGSAHWQDDGLSLWALPSSTGAVLPQGEAASLVLNPGHVIRQLSVSFRGFLARPRDWVLGLFSSTASQGAIQTPVAGCDRGGCAGLSLFHTSAGALITSRGSSANPDLSDQPPTASFALPAGTRRVEWALSCAAPGGCSLKGIANAAGISARPRDPLGHPAIFSIYGVSVR